MNFLWRLFRFNVIEMQIEFRCWANKSFFTAESRDREQLAAERVERREKTSIQAEPLNLYPGIRIARKRCCKAAEGSFLQEILHFVAKGEGDWFWQGLRLLFPTTHVRLRLKAILEGPRAIERQLEFERLSAYMRECWTKFESAGGMKTEGNAQKRYYRKIPTWQRRKSWKIEIYH